MKIKIADNLFVYHQKSAFAGCDNAERGPRAFEWEVSDVQDARFVTDSMIKYAEGPGQVAWLLEPFFLHPENYLAAMARPFDAVLTHNEYFALHNGWLWYPHGGSLIDGSKWGIREKKKGISILLSEKNTMCGHKLRHQIAETFGHRMDIYGLKCPVHPLEAYADYRYSVVIENERTPGYFTERLIDCISVGTTPIYWGCPNIGDFFDRRFILQFEDITEFSEVLYVAEEGHRPNRLALAGNLSEARSFAVCEDRIFEMYPDLFDA